MHELSIALSILDVAEEESVRLGSRVAAVHVKLGPLSGVVKEALASAYDLAREGTSLAQAELVVEETSLVVHCAACAVEAAPPSIWELYCPICGAAAEVVSGRELEVCALEIET